MYRLDLEKPEQFSGPWINCGNQIIGRGTKMKIFNSNMKAVLLYAPEYWKYTQRIINRLQVFINKLQMSMQDC